MITMASIEIARVFKKNMSTLRKTVELILDGYLLDKKIYSTRFANMTFIISLAESMNFRVSTGVTQKKYYVRVKPASTPVQQWQISNDNNPVIYIKRNKEGFVSVSQKNRR